jgi:hypothetical protein
MQLTELMEAVFLGLFIVIPLAILGFLGAVWFGLFVLAPRIKRALDRADVAEQETGDRPD